VLSSQRQGPRTSGGETVGRPVKTPSRKDESAGKAVAGAGCITCILIGDTGAGKSELGNRYLQDRVFQTSDSPDPVTLAPQVRSKSVNGMTRYVIDTEGHADGNSVSSTQIEKLAVFLRGWEHGVNGVGVVLNGQHDRFSQGVKDTLLWAYNTFATKAALGHMCIIFTRCYDGVPLPNLEKKQTEYRLRVQQFLEKISGSREVPVIPIFFVDSQNLTSPETEHNMVQFHGWLAGRSPLSTKQVKAMTLREKVEDQYESHVFSHYRYAGPENNKVRYAVYEDKKRKKITPYNGDPARYSEWQVTRTSEERAGCRITVPRSQECSRVGKTVVHEDANSILGFSSHDHTHFTMWRYHWTEELTETTDFDGEKSATAPKKVGTERKEKIGEGRERGWTQAY
jgi:hypothetical protein